MIISHPFLLTSSYYIHIVQKYLIYKRCFILDSKQNIKIMTTEQFDEIIEKIDDMWDDLSSKVQSLQSEIEDVRSAIRRLSSTVSIDETVIKSIKDIERNTDEINSMVSDISDRL